MQILYYVSGHGYGHATRTSEILRSLVTLRPDCTLHVRSNVPPHLFDGIERVRYHACSRSLDPGVVEESDSLGVDVPGTLNAIERYYCEREQHVAQEVRWVAEHDISLIVADFPPLAGEVAAACGLPCLGIGNFTWDWIYEPL
ncbi:MAG TPA: glycosyltransferase family protein, partial [Pirellulales bacterium]|nr:glycosyltransferase family protein [Pirellulales bacterium]